MTPEIVAKGAKPNAKTDLYSLSVILFFLCICNHPLEGESACPVVMDTEAEKRIYGESPVFIYDPDDISNRPIESLHKGAITRWPFLPSMFRLLEQHRRA